MSRHTIARLGHRGDGIAPGPVYAPRTLPGEVVEGAPDGDRIPDPRVLEPSPHRVAPPCPHYAGCGGCDLQHASDAFVAAWKTRIVRDALAAHGLPAPIAGIATSPPASRRRASFAARRTRKGTVVGFHARASDAVTDIPDCRVLTPGLLAARPVIAALAGAGASRGTALRVAATEGQAGLDLAVTDGAPLDVDLRADLAAIARDHDVARLTWNGEPLALARPPFQTFGTARVVPPPGAFLQATAHGQAALTASVRAATEGAARIADLFAGCGTFALPLARHAEIHAAEADPALIDALRAGWRGAPGLKPLTAEARDLFRRPLLAPELARFDAAVIDPPRAGAEAQSREIAASRLPRVASLSCNPATFARDAAILVAAGFALDWIRVVDQFRWSPHVELAAQFTRDHIPGT